MVGRTEKSGEQILDHVAMNVGQAVVASLKSVGKLLVIKSKQVHPGGLQVVCVNGILGHAESKLVGFAVCGPPFTPPPAITMV